MLMLTTRNAEIIDLYEERAAIREYDGGQRRTTAEHHAIIEVAERFGLKPSQVREIVW